MKKIAMLVALTVMVMGFAATASAVDLDAKGQFQFQMNFMDNTANLLSNKKASTSATTGDSEDDLNFWFRARTEFRFIANENLWAVLYTEYKNRIGNGHRNTSTSDASLGGAQDANDSGLYVKRAYLQYRFPGTEVLTSAGIMSVNLPGAAAGNMVLADADLGTFMVETPITDQIAIAGAFVRVADATNGEVLESDDEFDVFYGALPVTIDGLSATPYFAMANIGKNSVTTGTNFAAPAQTAYNKNFTAWWLGTSFSMDMFDPIVFDADIVYGSVDANQKHNDRSGLMFDAALTYTGLDFVQPKLVFAYTTGEDDKTDNGSERLPVITDDWAFGSTYFGGSALTSADMGNSDQVGFWTIGLSLEKISFFDKLSHDIHFLYIQGTNDKDLIRNQGNTLTNITADGDFLTTKDHVFEVDFNTNYQIYDELAAIVEFGYVNVDLDKDTWENGITGANVDFDPAVKLAIGLVYKF